MKEESETLIKLSNDDSRDEQTKTTLKEITTEQTKTTLREMTQKNYKNWVWISYFFCFGMIICCISLLYYGYQENDYRCTQFMFIGFAFTVGAGITYRIDVLIKLISVIFSNNKVSKFENSNQDVPLEGQ